MADEGDGERKGAGMAATSAKGALYVLLSAICFALAGVLIKSIPWSALATSGARSSLAALVLYAYLRLQGRRLVVNRQVIAGAAINFAMMQTFVIANKMTTAANAIVLQFTMPAWLILALWIFFGEKPKASSIVACAVIFAGISCFFFEQLSASGFLGNVIAIASGMAYAGVFLIKRIPQCDFESAAILSLVACMVCGIPDLLHETEFGAPTLAAVFVLGVVQVGFSYIFLSKGLDEVNPVAASLISTIEPILNPLLVAFFIGETISALSLVGALLVVGSATAYNVYEAMVS